MKPGARADRGWGRTAAKGIAVLLAYATALGLGLNAVFSAGLLL